jgi:replicative DNA helicase
MKKTMAPQLPHSIDAEEGLLGSLIIDPEAVAQVIDVVRPQDCYREAHRLIYEVIVQLYEQHIVADVITISNELERQNKLADAGGLGALISLVNGVPTSGNIVHYASIVAQKALYRRLIHAAGIIAAAAYAEETDALEKAEQEIFVLASRRRAEEITPLAQVLTTCLTTLDAIHERRQEIVGVPTGFRHLDTPLGGLQRSDLIILAARPGTGKTALALNIATNAASQCDRHVAIFSLEMSKEQLGLRLLSLQTKIDQQRLRMGWIHDHEWEKVVGAIERLIHVPLWIDDTGGLSLTSLRSKARGLHAQHGLDLVIVDYLQLMHATLEGKRYTNREQEIAEISRGLKSIAKELNIPVLALAQLSRAVESRREKIPQLSDLRESGAIENDADVVLFIYREEMYDAEKVEAKNSAEIIIAKHRNGPVGTIQLGFEASQTRFYTLEDHLEG